MPLSRADAGGTFLPATRPPRRFRAPPSIRHSECGWCKDRWGLSWQITPRTLTEALAAGGDEAKRAFAAMMTMRKIDVAKIDTARRG
jgi:predicted 3-demethylubiquinone-9 3-methyltransferase (glyoxalase superfamily)